MSSLKNFLGKWLSLLQLVLLRLDPATIVDGPGHLPLPTREQIVLNPLLISLSALVSAFSSDCLLGLLAVLIGPYSIGLDSLSVLNALFVLIQHHPVELFTPFRVERRPEVIFNKGREASAEEVIENIMGSDWCDGPEDYVIVVLAPELRRQCVIGLVDLHKLVGSLLVVGISLGVVLQSQLPIGFLDVIKGGLFGDSEYGVVGVERVRVVFVEELLFRLIRKAVLVEKAFKGGVGISQGVLVVEDFIVVGSLVVVRQHLKGLRNVMKPLLRSLAVLLVLIRMPLRSEFLEGALDFEEGGTLGNPQNGIIVLQILIRGHIQGFLVFDYKSARQNGYLHQDIILDFSSNYATKNKKPNPPPQYHGNMEKRKSFRSVSQLVRQKGAKARKVACMFVDGLEELSFDPKEIIKQSNDYDT